MPWSNVKGTSTHILLPEPDGSIGDGTPPRTLKATAGVQEQPTLGEQWKQAVDSLNEAIEAAL